MPYTILQYPISGSLKPTLLVLEWFIALLFFEIGFGLLIRSRKRKKRIIGENLERGFMHLVFSYSAMWMLIICASFYISTPAIQKFFMNLSHLSIMIGTLLFLYYNEKYTILFLKKHLLTILYLILIIGYLFCFIFYDEITGYYMIANLPFFFYCIGGYIQKFRAFSVKKEYLGVYRISIFIFLIGIISLFTGFLLTGDNLRTTFNLGLEVRLIGDIIQLISTVLLIFFLYLVPTFAEYEWKQMIDSIIIMHKDGLLIYNESVNEEVDQVTGSLVSGSLTLLKTMLEKTTKKKGTSILEQKGKIIIIEPGKFIYGVLICDDLLESLQQLLKILVNKIESIYHNILETWNGDLKIFTPVKSIVRDIFDIKVS